MSTGLPWKEKYRDRATIAAYVQQRCSTCGMWVGAGSTGGGHGRLFEKMCHGVPRPTSRKRYHQSVHIGGWYVNPKTLPQDVTDQVRAVAAEAKAQGKTIYQRKLQEPATKEEK